MKLFLEKVKYDYKDLSPSMSSETLEYHRDNLAAGYVKRFNNNEGDKDFNEAGAFLHNIFFPQLQKPSGRNKPHGPSLEIINGNWGSFADFCEEFKSIAMGIQGLDGFICLEMADKNYKRSSNKMIVLLVDWWEHAWALDYQSDKAKYLDNIWKIINWEVINDRLNIKNLQNIDTGK